MRKYLTLFMGAVLLTTIVSNVATSPKTSPKTSFTTTQTLSSNQVPLSLGTLPAAGYVDLDPLNSSALEALGLGGPAPTNNPPNYPYNQNGMYWSKPFSVVKGDTLQITVYSDSPISWFGIDWANLSIRGILATTEMDEDGQDFNPQYPVLSSQEQVPAGYKLMLSYKILDDTDCVLVLKNNDPDNSGHLKMTVSLKPSISFRRILKRIPILKNFVSSNNDDEED